MLIDSGLLIQPVMNSALNTISIEIQEWIYRFSNHGRVDSNGWYPPRAHHHAALD